MGVRVCAGAEGTGIWSGADVAAWVAAFAVSEAQGVAVMAAVSSTGDPVSMLTSRVPQAARENRRIPVGSHLDVS
jgi:hypothetical protein